MQYESNSHQETQGIAIEFAKKLTAGDVLCLSGDLGVGKTAFVQGLVQGLGISEYVSSPTFTIVNCYDGDMPVYHFDVYRISDEDEMYEIGYEEYIYANGVSIIEWPEMISGILPDKRYDITIEKNLEKHEDYRKITIEKRGE